MLEFKKYSSIENSFSREFMEHVVAEMPQDLEYVVQEKVHGANTSLPSVRQCWRTESSSMTILSCSKDTGTE